MTPKWRGIHSWQQLAGAIVGLTITPNPRRADMNNLDALDKKAQTAAKAYMGARVKVSSNLAQAL